MAIGNPFVRKAVPVGVIGVVALGFCWTAVDACTREPGAPRIADEGAREPARPATPPAENHVTRDRPPGPPMVDVALPTHANGPTAVTERATKMRVTFALRDARPVGASHSGNAVAFPGAGPNASNVRLFAEATGAEDFVEFDEKPAREELDYRVDVHAAAGLRLVENVLELLDARGVPRLRMAAPYVLAQNGRHDATVSLEDCAADRSPRGPWGRPVTAPGRAECTVRVAWGGADPVSYPAVVDPLWTATKGAMTDARRGHTATLLANGKVLVVGGESTAGAVTTYKKTAELFDPATDTFAATGSMTEGRSFHGAARLSTGNVLVAGGSAGATVVGSTEIYDVTTATFHTADPLIVARGNPQLVAFGTAQAVIAGGQDATGTVFDTSEIFSAAEAWSDAGRMNAKRVGHFLTTMPNGQPLVCGGITSKTLGDLASCDRLPGAGTWTAAATFAEPRHDFGADRFSNGKLLVAGGFQSGAGKVLASAESLDPNAPSWVPAGTLAQARTNHTLTALPSGAAIVAGGAVRDATGKITSYLKSAELFDPVAKTWSALTDLAEARAYHTATLLDDGRVLVTGGGSLPAASLTAELLTLDPDGTACTSIATCASGFCADGVCCKTVCDALCNACAVAVTGKPSGTCAPVLAAKDPRNDCKDDGTPSCKQDGLCDGAGACEAYPAKTCTPSACTAGKDCTSGFCADGICCDSACTGKCEACVAAKKDSGGDGLCGPVKTGTDPDAECGKMGAGTCSGDGLCDGAGACRVPNAGKSCAPAACVDGDTLGLAATCSPAGDCTPATTSCVPFACDSATVKCKATCAGDTDCATGAHCTNGKCARSENGVACKLATDCTSVECVDGVCCDAACDGQCEACDVPGSVGTCSPVPSDDPPHGSRSACSGTKPCAGHCNGLARTICIYPQADTECGSTTSCTDGLETGDRCNSRGDCVSTPTKCAPFACGTDACNTECTGNADCADDARCKSGVCLGPEVSTCPDGGTPGADGGACVVPGHGSGSGGCGCRTARDSSSSSGVSNGLLALGLAAAWRRTRTRRPRRPRLA